MEPNQPIKLADQLLQLRGLVSIIIGEATKMAEDRPRKCGAEITLGLRKLQEARMWFGVSEALELGLNPWENQIKED